MSDKGGIQEKKIGGWGGGKPMQTEGLCMWVNTRGIGMGKIVIEVWKRGVTEREKENE